MLILSLPFKYSHGKASSRHAKGARRYGTRPERRPMILHASSCCACAPQVRDLLTTEHEQQLKRRGQPGPASSLSRDAIPVDAIVSTIGFPLVGGPAGTMEGGRQADVAKAILTAKNVPYVVAAPLLIQARIHLPLAPTHVLMVNSYGPVTGASEMKLKTGCMEG